MKYHALRFIAVLTAMAAWWCTAFADSASQRYVRGIVRDSITAQGLPYASISINPSGKKTVTDDRGIFEIMLPDKSTGITAGCQGYSSKTVPVKHSTINLYDIYLTPEATELREMVVKKQRYSKHDNPAVEFAKRIRRLKDLTDPHRNEFYSYDRYDRTSLSLNDFDTTARNRLMRSMPFLAEHVDSSEIDGHPILNVSLKQSASTIMWSRNGKKEKKVVRGISSEGVDEFLDKDNVMTVLDDLFDEVDLYEGEIKLLRNNFVSPLSAVAPDFYRFYLVDSAAIIPGKKEPHIALAFYPRNKSFFGFSGHLYVPAGDTTMFISRIDMHAPKEINLNFIKDLSIAQTFDRAHDGSRLKTADNMLMVFSVLPDMPQLYVSRKISYRNHRFDRPQGADSIFGNLGATIVMPGADTRDSSFWRQEQTVRPPDAETRVAELVEKLRKKPLFYWGEKILGIMFSGYVATGKNSKFDYGPVNATASYNSLEGLRLRAGGMTTANLSKNWFGRGYVAYGFRDRRWKYSAEAEYSFNEKKYHSREFPMHSLRLTHRYDIDRLGSHYLSTSPDNFVLSLARMSDNRFTYLRETKLEHTLELANHFSVVTSAKISQQNATRFVPFVTASGNAVSHYNNTVFGITLRFAPGEKIYQAKSYRRNINESALIMTLSHHVATKGFAGSAYSFNRTEMAVSKSFALSMLGRLDLNLNGGHIWSSAPFPELLIPNANLSYTIQPQSFALMNPMEFINSSYVSLHAAWQLRGALFNLIPGVRRLGLREVLSFSGLYGHLSERNRPTADNNLLLFPDGAAITTMHGKPYMEISAGIDNIFRLFRVDYVWRLSYLDVPYSIDRHGLRVAMHLTF